MTTHPPADVIRTLLVDQILADESDVWEVFVGFLPQSPDKAICVYDTAGQFDGRIMASGEKIEHEGIMIHVRGTDYLSTWQKANDIALTLDALNNTEVTYDSDETYTIHNASRTSPIIPMGVEVVGSKRRHEFSINMLLTLSVPVVGGHGLFTVTIDHPFVVVGDHEFYVQD